MIAYAFDDCASTGVTYTEAFASDTVKIAFTDGGTVHDGVADDDVLFRLASESLGWLDDNATAAKAFAHIIVALACELHGDAFCQKGGKALPSGTCKTDRDRVIR